MYKAGVWDHFSSAHYLRNYQGKCENLHGHNWKVEVVVKGEDLDKSGMLIDFGNLKKYLKEILDLLDHKCINEEIDYFKEKSPSSENLARYIYDKLTEKIKDFDVSIDYVKVFESENSFAIYSR
ncbi:MAG: 6-carboxytetrahydropterin synthase QueD [Proteobacteria bacterium]|nr:6-carboxytetrahydropterin synthase QueD [Pseudomonadota bacterium]